MFNALKPSYLSLCFIFISIAVQAQDSPVVVTRKTVGDRGVDLEYQKTDPGTYTVVVKFRDMRNTNVSDVSEYTAKDYSGKLATIDPINKGQSVNFSYSYSSLRGKLNPKYNPNFAYILPFKKGAKVRVAHAGFANTKLFGSTAPEDWKAYSFYTTEETEVAAIRKGIVVDVKDLHDSNPDVSYTNQTNSIIIEHADGTLATYRGFKKGSTVVKIGQTVLPGTLLGANAVVGESGRFHISLMITYLKSTDVESTGLQAMKNYKSHYGFITPKFYTADTTTDVLVPKQYYIAEITPEILKKELTKKELKQIE